VSAQDQSGLDSLSEEEQIAGAAALSGIALLLIILGVIALVVVIVLVAATTTGVLVYKKRMYDVNAHAFEGTIIEERSIPMGGEIAAPSWATEMGGSGINPSWGKDLRQSITTNPLNATQSGQGVEMQQLRASDGNAIPEVDRLEDLAEVSSDY
jgi:hypothetical protein